jgi:hypothetical protein
MHIGFIRDGAIVHFTNCAGDFMKVCDRNGHGGVVDLSSGQYISMEDLMLYYCIDPNTAEEDNESVWVVL